MLRSRSALSSLLSLRRLPLTRLLASAGAEEVDAVLGGCVNRHGGLEAGAVLLTPHADPADLVITPETAAANSVADSAGSLTVSPISLSAVLFKSDPEVRVDGGAVEGGAVEGDEPRDGKAAHEEIPIAIESRYILGWELMLLASEDVLAHAMRRIGRSLATGRA